MHLSTSDVGGPEVTPRYMAKFFTRQPSSFPRKPLLTVEHFGRRDEGFSRRDKDFVCRDKDFACHVEDFCSSCRDFTFGPP